MSKKKKTSLLFPFYEKKAKNLRVHAQLRKKEGNNIDVGTDYTTFEMVIRPRLRRKLRTYLAKTVQPPVQ